MLAVMKKKALEISKSAKSNTSEDSAESDDSDSENSSSVEEGPVYKSIVEALQVLKPDELELTNTSDQNGSDGESHFELKVVASIFGDLDDDNRNKLILMLLGEIIPNIKDIQITATTQEES